MRRNVKTNPALTLLIADLKKVSRENNAPIWRDIARRLEKPSSRWAEVNLSHIERHAKKNETLIIPGKVLGAGALSKPVNLVAFNFSAAVPEKVSAAGGKTIHLGDYISKNPKGKGLRIMG